MELLLAEPGATNLARRALLARELGHRGLLVLFTRHDKRNAETLAALRTAAPTLAITGGILADAKRAPAYRKLYAAVVSPCSREAAESKAVTHLLEPETGSRSDFLHHRNSGLNQVLLNLCKQGPRREQKGIITSARPLFDGKRRAVLLGRMAQNARWCRKAGIPYAVTSGSSSIWEQRDKASLDALARELRKT